MMPDNPLRLQLAAGLGDRRQMVLRIAICTLPALPFIGIAMPARAQASGIVMVILFTSFFGAAVSHTHLRQDFRLARLKLLPTPRCILGLDLVLSSAYTRLPPVLVVLTGFVIVNARGATTAAMIHLAGLLCAALLLLTALGIAVGRLARGNGEVHLLGVLTAAVLAFLSGITPLPDRLAWVRVGLAWNPVARLLTTLEGLTTGSVNVPAAELILASAVLGSVIVVTILRWRASSK
jgi:hypothetical protein